MAEVWVSQSLNCEHQRPLPTTPQSCADVCREERQSFAPSPLLPATDEHAIFHTRCSTQESGACISPGSTVEMNLLAEVWAANPKVVSMEEQSMLYTYHVPAWLERDALSALAHQDPRKVESCH